MSTKRSGRLNGKVALVTGGGSGIGRAVCELFAKEGASVAVLDINAEGIKETLQLLDDVHGNKHCTIESDVSSSDQAKQAYGTAEEKLGGKVTILVNSAGIERGNFLDVLEEKDLDDVIRVNTKGTFLMSKEFVITLKARNEEEGTRGVIVNMSSMAGVRGFPAKSNYSASKFAVIGLTKTTALEYPKHKVRCNAVLPSIIDTPMTTKPGNKELRDFLLKQNPMGRFGKPKEVANVCLFLASDESSYVNGATIEVCGGFNV